MSLAEQILVILFLVCVFSLLVAGMQTERDAARADAARAEAALEKILIGGNHLGSALTHMLGDDFLEYETDFNQACEILNDPIKYDLWVCWAVMMRVRDSLEVKRNPG